MGKQKKVNGEMTNAEIYKNWKEAASPTKQLRILADINETSVATIQHIIDEEKAKEEAKRQNIKAPEPVEAEAENQTVQIAEDVEHATEQPEPAKGEMEINRRNPYVTEEMVDMIVNLYKEGLKLDLIAERVGAKTKTVSYHLRKLRKEGKLQLCRMPPRQAKPFRQAHFNMCGWTDRLRGIAGNIEGYEETVMFLGDENHASVKFKAGGVTYRISIERLESEKNPAE